MSGRFDRDLMDFVRSWAPYGGPPADEVMVEFGMTPDQLAERVQLIVATERARRFGRERATRGRRQVPASPGIPGSLRRDLGHKSRHE
jgi:hypothetical protein